MSIQTLPHHYSLFFSLYDLPIPAQVAHRMKNVMSIKQKHALTQCRLEILSLCECVGKERLTAGKGKLFLEILNQNEF